MSFFSSEDNRATFMGRNTNEAGSAVDPAQWPWFVGFEKTLTVPHLTRLGPWINENVPGGCRLVQPRWYYFTSEEDALLVYLRFS
jgi:hypothetical protein